MFKKLKKLWVKKYSHAEMEAVEQHIEKYFGEIDAVLHEVFSTGLHVDVYAVKPSHKRNFYTLITCGMGARKMNTPQGQVFESLKRAELVISVPAYWQIKEADEIWSWPIHVIKTLSHFPLDMNTWLGYGHTVDFGHEMSEKNNQCGALLTIAYGDEGCEVCTLPDGEKVNFYQVVPLYREEMAFKDKHGSDKLINRLQKVSGVVIDEHRQNVGRGNPDSLPVIMDIGEEHSKKVPELKLPLEEITGFQHMAIYLRWAMEHDLMGELFMEDHAEIAHAVREGTYEGDLREFLRDELQGILRCDLFNKTGERFSLWYYGEDVDETHYYPSDVDQYALYYFGEEKYNCAAFKTEGYLFVPWTEDYYQAMAARIDDQFRRWQAENQSSYREGE